MDRITSAEAVEAWGDRNRRDPGCAVSSYAASRVRKVLFIIACLVLCILAVGLSIGTGPYDIGIIRSYSIIWDHLTGNPEDQLLDFIVWEKRLPRTVLGILTGAGLAAGGCVMQSILRNPLADTYTTGISAGAGLGATLAFTVGLSMASGPMSVVINSFVFALMPMGVVILVSKLRGGSSIVMVMAGIAMMYLFNAISAVFKIMSDPNALSALYAWQLGSVAGGSWDTMALPAIAVTAGTVAMCLLAQRINVLSSGDEYAKSLGIDVSSLRNGLLVLITLVVAVVVSLTGLIGFVGLVSPHICRMAVGSDSRYLIPASAVFGAFLLLAADVAGRAINPPAEMQVGIVTAFMGAPLFLYLALRQRRSMW